VAGDGSRPDTNPGSGVRAVGAIDYRDWCVNATCTVPATPAQTTLRRHKVLTRGNGNRILIVAIRSQADVNGGLVVVRPTSGPRHRTVVHRGKGRVNLGRLHRGRHVYQVRFKGTQTAAPAQIRVVIRVRRCPASPGR
jgi:hypothetical protein